jgi:hypothetical protein
LLFGQPAPPRTAETEPNDDSTIANRISAGVPIEGHIGARQAADRSDRDVYEIRVPKAHAVIVEITGVPRLDLVIEGYDAAGQRVFKANDGAAGAGERLRATDLAAGRLFISVREVWVQGQPPTENSTDAYTLTVGLEPARP